MLRTGPAAFDRWGPYLRGIPFSSTQSDLSNVTPRHELVHGGLFSNMVTPSRSDAQYRS